MKESDEALFKQISVRKAYAEIIEQIADAIRAGKLKPGDKLPSEPQLAELMGVSRASVREALSALKLVGLVKSRPGSGNYIRRTSSETNALLEFLDGENPLEILEARELIETNICGLAAAKASEEDLARLRFLVEKMEAETAQGRYSFELDNEFHLCVAKAAHNNILVDVLVMLQGRMGNAVWRTFKERTLELEGRPGNYVDEHRSIYEAIRKRDPGEARKEMMRHLRSIRKAILEAGRTNRSD